MRVAVFYCVALVALIASGCAHTPQLPESPAPEQRPRSEHAEPAAVQQNPQTTPEEEVKADVSRLLEQLSSIEFNKREAAEKELHELLETGRGAVLAMLQKENETTTDAEMKTRLERLLRPYTRWSITPAVLDAIPNIVELLEEDSRTSMRTAVEALRKLNIKDTNDTLFTIMQQAKHGKRNALEVLITRADTSVIEYFAELLGNKYLEHNAKYAFRRIGNKALPSLKRVFQLVKSDNLRRLTAQALANNSKEGRQVLLEVIEDSESYLLVHSLKGMLDYPGIMPPVAPSLKIAQRLLKHETPEVRAVTAKLLGRNRDQKTVEIIKSLLYQDNNAEVRRMAVEVLSETCNRKVVPALIRALKDPDNEVRKLAAESLEDFEDERALKPLIEALGDPEESVVSAARCALCDFDRSFIPRMVKMYENAKPSVRKGLFFVFRVKSDERTKPLMIRALKDASRAVRAAAAENLRRFEGEDVVSALVVALGDSSAAVRENAASSLCWMGDKSAVPSLLKIFEDEWEKEPVRCAAACALGSIGDQRAIEPLIEIVEKGGESELHNDAVRALMNIEGEEVFKTLSLVSRGNTEYGDLPEALARIGRKESIPCLVDLLEKHSTINLLDQFRVSLGEEVTRAILRFGEDAIGPLVAAAKSKQPQLKAGALHVLALLRHQKAFDMLLEALNHKDAQVRFTAARVIPLYKDSRTVEPLIKLLADKDDLVRRTAVTSLGELEDTRAVHPLIALLQDEDGRLRREAVSALGELRDERAVRPLIDLLTEEEESWVSSEVACTLGKIDSRAAIEFLILLLLDDSEGVPEAAASALSAFKDTHAVDALIRALEDNNEDVLDTAANSLAKTGDKDAIAPLMRRYEDVSPYYRKRILECLRLFRSSETVELFLSVLENGADRYTTEEAIYALGEIGDTRAAEPLRRLLKNEKSRFRMPAAAALLRFSDNDARDILKRTFGDKNSSDQEWAAYVMRESPHPDAVPWLIEALKGDYGCTQGYAAEALGRLGVKQACGPLITVLSEEESLSIDVVYALRKLGDKRTAGPLIEVLAKNLDYDIREAAHDALHQITGQNFGWNWQKWQRWWEQEEQKERGQQQKEQ